MPGWSGGYVSDLEYVEGFYIEQSPAMLDLACQISGIEAPNPGRGYRYCELGCGQGYTVTLLAAANPEAEFVAVDFNPAHIARARALADAAQIANIRFIETGFDELASGGAGDLPGFDYVTMHGVYSWVSPQTRKSIVSFLQRCLNPGGVVYVTYNAMPGWTDAFPMQRLFTEVAGLSNEPSRAAMARALATAERMQKAGSPFFRDSRIFERVQRSARNGEFAYLAHEYLNSSWQPLYHADVARELSAARLTFAGSAWLVENFPQLCTTPEQRAVLDEVGAPEVRETLKDFFVDRRFRKDVFVRGARRMSVQRRDEALREVRLALLPPREHVSLKVEVPLGAADLEPRVYGPMLDALAEGARTVGELLDLPEVCGRSQTQAVEVAGLLTGSMQALPVVHSEPAEGGAPSRRFNLAVAARSRHEEINRRVALASPYLGNGLVGTVLDLFGYDAIARGAADTPDALAQILWQPIAARGEKLIKDGEPVASEAECLEILHGEARSILEKKLPLWKRMGCIAPEAEIMGGAAVQG